MPKRIGNIYEEIVSVDNCREAILDAAKHKKKRGYVQDVLDDLNTYAEDLSRRFKNKDFISPYKYKKVKDSPSGKERDIQIPRFYPDQCAQHAIVRIISKPIMRSSYYWSCANLPGRGTDHACISIERFTVRMKEKAKYAFKGDARHCYASIPHEKLKDAFKRKFKDRRALELIFMIIDSYHEPDDEDTGVPLGNYTSPWFVELFLQKVDHFIKDEKGVPSYTRYADDIVLGGSNKRKLRKVTALLPEFYESMGLTLKDNYQLFPICRKVRRFDHEAGKPVIVYQEGTQRGNYLGKPKLSGRKIDFVGKCFGRGFTTVRKRRALSLMRQCRKIKKMQIAGTPIPVKECESFMARKTCLRYVESNGLYSRYLSGINIANIKFAISNHSRLLQGIEPITREEYEQRLAQKKEKARMYRCKKREEELAEVMTYIYENLQEDNVLNIMFEDLDLIPEPPEEAMKCAG